MDELKLSANNTYPPVDEITDKDRIKKKRGCGCFLMGCFAIILFLAIPPIGFMVYLGTLNDADYGAFAIKALTYPDVSREIKKAIEEESDFTPEEKTAILSAYDALLNKYDSLPADKKDSVNRNIVIVIKKAFSEPESFSKEPPPELTDLFMTLGIGLPVPSQIPATDGAPVSKAPSTAPPTGNSKDPYSFDLPTTADTQKQDTVEDSQYDF